MIVDNHCKEYVLISPVYIVYIILLCIWCLQRWWIDALLKRVKGALKCWNSNLSLCWPLGLCALTTISLHSYYTKWLGSFRVCFVLNADKQLFVFLVLLLKSSIILPNLLFIFLSDLMKEEDEMKQWHLRSSEKPVWHIKKKWLWQK